MNFRRQPFQFTTIDPAKRHAELQKRFGLPSDEMYVDYVNPGVMGAGFREPATVGSSPRLQHRVPIFSQGYDHANPERCQNVDTEHKPRIRTIPIEVEGADTTKRHRTFSGPAGSFIDTNCDLNMPTSPLFGHKLPNLSNMNGETATRPKVCNIPIKVETSNRKKKFSPLSDSCNIDKKSVPVKTNGCAASKSSAEVTPEPAVEKPPETDISIPLKQIENVLTKLKTYHEEVKKFSGTVKDKQYRYLDEMLTRCMLDLDNVDTLGLDNVRQSRKSAVKQVQASIDLLETKINAHANTVNNSAVLNNSESNTDVEMKETSTDKNVQDNIVTSTGDSSMGASESALQDMETSDTETVPVNKAEPIVDQPAGESTTATTLDSKDNVKTESDLTKTVSESAMEVEKPEASIIVEEMSDTINSEVEESNQDENIPVNQVVKEPVIEMEASDTQAETVLEPVVEMEALDIQIDETVQNTDPDPEPLVTEPVDSSESTNSTLPNDPTVAAVEAKELEQSTVENSNIVVTEMTEEADNSRITDISPTPVVEESNEKQTVSKKCNLSDSS